MGQASAIQQYTWRLQVVGSSNLHATEFQNLMLRLPLKDVWLFGEDVNTITSKCAAQKAVARCFSSAKQRQGQKETGQKFPRVNFKGHHQQNFPQRGEKRKGSFHPKNAKRSKQENPYQGKSYQGNASQGGNRQNNKLQWVCAQGPVGGRLVQFHQL